MNLSVLAQVLWATGFIELVALVLVLIIRKRWRTFPVFTAYIIFQVLDSIALYGIHRFESKTAYFWAFWIVAIFDLLLQIGVVFELARSVLRPTGTWVSDARRMFLGLALVATILAAAVAYGVNPVIPNTLDNWIEKGNLFAVLLNAELFVAMGLASTRLGLAWRHHVMGISTGWIFYAFVGLLVEGAYSYLGPNWHGVVLDNMRIIAYQLATVYWMINLWLPEPATRTLSYEMQTYLAGLQVRVEAGLRGVSSIKRS